MVKRLLKFGLELLVDFVTARWVWAAVLIMTVSNLFFSGGYISGDNDRWDWIMAIGSLIGFPLSIVLGKKINTKLKDKWDL
jgi:hypothetical protein